MTMLRHLLYLLPTLLLCSCGADDDGGNSPSPRQGDSSISFQVGTEAATATRGTDMTRGERNAFDTSKQFRAYAWDNNGNSIVYMIGTYDASNIVSYNSSLEVWTTTEKYYWPTDDDAVVNFYVFYPVDAPFDTTDRTINYNTTALDGTADLLYGKNICSKGQSTYTLLTNTYAAEINFRHALSKIDFQANVVSPGVAVTLNSIEICNILSKGKFTFPTGDTTGEEAADYGSWIGRNTVATYRYPMASGKRLTAEPVALGRQDQALQLIPQVRSGWNTSVTLAANDAIATPNVYLKIGCSIMVDDTDYSDNGYVYVPFPINWQAANIYTYTLTFGGGYDAEGHTILAPLAVTASIAPWTTATASGDIQGHVGTN